MCYKYHHQCTLWFGKNQQYNFAAVYLFLPVYALPIKVVCIVVFALQEVTPSRARHAQDITQMPTKDTRSFIGGTESAVGGTYQRDIAVIRARYTASKYVTLCQSLVLKTQAIISSDDCLECFFPLISFMLRLLGMLCSALSRPLSVPLPEEVETPLAALNKMLVFHLNSKSAIQRFCTGLVIMEWTKQEKVCYTRAI